MTRVGQEEAHGGYQAYLVRLSQEGPDAPWRVLTRDAATGEERRFATLEQLFVFLHRRTHGWSPSAPMDTTPDEAQPP